jgi:hypothetical protein
LCCEIRFPGNLQPVAIEVIGMTGAPRQDRNLGDPAQVAGA